MIKAAPNGKLNHGGGTHLTIVAHNASKPSNARTGTTIAPTITTTTTTAHRGLLSFQRARERMSATAKMTAISSGDSSKARALSPTTTNTSSPNGANGTIHLDHTE